MSGGAKLAIGIALVVVVVGGAYLQGGAKGGGRPVEVRLEQTGKRDLVAAVTASGQIEAKKDVNISAEVTAKIMKLRVKEGDMVKEGDLLVDLDQSQFSGAVERSRAALASSQAAAIQAQATRDQSKRNLDRLKELKRINPTAVPDQDMETATENFDVAQANLGAMNGQVDQSKASLKEAQDNLARTRIVSPISGRVVRLAREEGEVAVPGTFSADVGLIMRIADLSTILAKVKVNETDVVRLAHNEFGEHLDRCLPRHHVCRSRHQDRQQRRGEYRHDGDRDGQGGGLRGGGDTAQPAEGCAAGPEHDGAHRHRCAEGCAQRAHHCAHHPRADGPAERCQGGHPDQHHGIGQAGRHDGCEAGKGNRKVSSSWKTGSPSSAP